MAYKYMDKVFINDGDQRKIAYESQDNLVSATNGVWILIPDEIQRIGVTISFTGGATGKVQTTTDKIGTVLNGTPESVDWPLGVVSITTQDAIIGAISAIRAVQETAGTMKITVRAQ